MASEEEYSDLTELETDDDEKTTTKKKTKATSGKKDGGYKIKNALKVPRATTYTAQALHDQIYSCDINLEPEYQRDVVWSEAKQIGIIDSVFRNFYIPPIIFAVNTFEDGSENKTCIDGKQRLTSIHRFMDGLIPHRDPLTNEKLWYKDVPTGTSKSAKTRRLLPEKYRRLFANKQIVCVEYQEITDADEREIFQRVQLGMALTPAEKLQVIKTPRADFIRDLQNAYMKEDGWLGAGSLEWDTSRGSDFRGLAQAVYYMDKYSTAKVPVSSMTQLEKWLGLGEPFSASFQSKVEDSYRIFAEMVQDKTLCKIFKKPAKVSPIEFILIGVFIFVHKDQASLALLSAGIGQLREDVREKHLDIRMNTRVSKTLIEFIQRWDPKSTKIPEDTGGPAGSTVNNTGVKRKRPASKKGDKDDVESEDDEAPMLKKKTLEQKPLIPSTSMPTPAPPPLPQSTQAQATPPTSTPLPGTDRMAALRKAKEAIAQKQAQRPAPMPTGPRSLAMSASNDLTPNPQMLPSPGQTYSFPPSTQLQVSSANASSPALPSPSLSLPPSTAIDKSLMATMMRGTNPNNEPRSTPSSTPRTTGLPPVPPPPFSGGGGSVSSADGSHRGADRERDRDRDRERDRDRDRDRGYHGRGYDDRDRDRDRDRGRYDPHHRESGGYSSGRRSPDDLGRPRTTSGRRDPPR